MGHVKKLLNQKRIDMTISLELKYEQLLAFVRQLPLKEKKRLIKAVLTEISQEEKEKTNLQKLLLAGPTWGEEEYQAFLEAQAQVNQIGNNAIN